MKGMDLNFLPILEETFFNMPQFEVPHDPIFIPKRKRPFSRHRIWPGEGSTDTPLEVEKPLCFQTYWNKWKHRDARGAREVWRCTSSINFHRPVPRRSGHIGPRISGTGTLVSVAEIQHFLQELQFESTIFHGQIWKGERQRETLAPHILHVWFSLRRIFRANKRLDTFRASTSQTPFAVRATSLFQKFLCLVAEITLAWTTLVCDMGGCKTYGGRKTYQRTRFLDPPQKSFWSALSWILVQEKQSTDTWGGWRTYHTRGCPKPLFWEGCHSWGFPPPSFFHPPMASSSVSYFGVRKVLSHDPLVCTLLFVSAFNLAAPYGKEAATCWSCFGRCRVTRYHCINTDVQQLWKTHWQCRRHILERDWLHMSAVGNSRGPVHTRQSPW